MSGLLIDGQIVPVPGVSVIGPHDAAWSHLSPGDGTARSLAPQIVLLHKTKGDDPERVLPGYGPVGRCQRVAKFWQDDPKHSGAQLVGDGHMVACLADLVRFEAWHGNQANLRSIGFEHYEEDGGIVYQGTLDNAALVYPVLAERLGIQIQFPRVGTYHDAPLRRFADGGKSLVGFFGHCHVTNQRGRWDPGYAVFNLIEKRCNGLGFDFDAGEDLVFWKDWQSDLNRRGHTLVVDGIPGPRTRDALKLEGYRGGILARGKAG